MNSPFQDSWLNSDNLRLYLETPESELIRNVNPRAQQTVITAKRGNQSPPSETKQIFVKSVGGLAIELPKLALNQLTHDKQLQPPSQRNDEMNNKKNRIDFTSSVRNFQLHSPLSQSYTSLKQPASSGLEGPLQRNLESPLYIPLQQPQQFQSPQMISSYAKWNSPRSLSPSYLQYQRQQQLQTSQSQREAQEQANATREAFMRRKFSNTMKNTFCLRNKIRSGGSYRDFGLTSEPSVNNIHKGLSQQQQQIQQQQQQLDQQKSSLGGIQVKSVLPKREKLLPSSAPKKFVIPTKGNGPSKQQISQYPPISKYDKILSLMNKDNNSRFVSSNDDNSNMNSNDGANDVASSNAYFSLFGVSSRAIFNKEQLLNSQRSQHRQIEIPSKTSTASPDIYSNINTPTIFNANDQQNLQQQTQTQFQLLQQSSAAPGIVLSTSQLTLEPPRPPFKPSHIIQSNRQSERQIITYNNTNLSSLIAPHDDSKNQTGKNNNSNKTSFNISDNANNFSLNNEAYKTISLEKKNRIQSDIQLLQQQRLLQGYDFSKKMRNTLSMYQLQNGYPKKVLNQNTKETQQGKNGSNNNQQLLEVVGKSKGIKPQSQLDDFMGIFQMNKNMMQSQLQQEAEQVKKLDKIVEEKDKRQKQIELAQEVEREFKKNMEREQQILKEKQLLKQGQIEQFKERQMRREAQKQGMQKQNEEKNKIKQIKKEEEEGGKEQQKDMDDKRNGENQGEEGKEISSEQRELNILKEQKQQQQQEMEQRQGNEEVRIENGKNVISTEGKEDVRSSRTIPDMQSSDKGRMKFSRVDSKGNIIGNNNNIEIDEQNKMVESQQRNLPQEQQHTSEQLMQGQQQQSVSEAEIPRWAMQEPDKLEKLAEANEKIAWKGGDGKINGIKEQIEEEYADEEQINVISDIHNVIQTLHNDGDIQMTKNGNIKNNGAKMLEEKGVVSYVQRALIEGEEEKIVAEKQDGTKHDDGLGSGGSIAVVMVKKQEDDKREQLQQTSITVINPPPSMENNEQIQIPQNQLNTQDNQIYSTGNNQLESQKSQEPSAGIIPRENVPMESVGEMKEYKSPTGQEERLPQPIILIIPAEETKQKVVDADKIIEGKNDGIIMGKQDQGKDSVIVSQQQQGKEGEFQNDKGQKISDSQVKEIANGDKMQESNSRNQKEDTNNWNQIAQSQQPQLQQQQSQQHLLQQQEQQSQQQPSPSSSSLIPSQQPKERISISVSQAQDTEPSSVLGQQDTEQKQEDPIDNDEGGFVMKKVIDFDSLKVLRDKTINRLSVQTSQKKQQLTSNIPGSAQLPSKVQNNAKQLTIQTEKQQSSSRSIVNSPNKSKMNNSPISTNSNSNGANQNSNSNSYVQNINANNNNSSNNNNYNTNNNNIAGNSNNNLPKTPMKQQQQQQQPTKKAIISPTAAAQNGPTTTVANKFSKKNNTKTKPKRKEEEQPAAVVVEEISEEQKRQEKQREQDLLIAQKLEEVKDKVKQGVKSVIKDQIAKKLQAQRLNAKQKELDGGDGEDGQNGEGSNNNGNGQAIPSIAEYHSAVMELYSACIDDLRETASSSNTGSANSLSNTNNNNQENTKPDGHDFELRGMRHFDAGMSATIGKALETELRKTEMNEAEVERFRYIYEINTKVHVLYSGMVKMLGGADKVRKLISAVLRRVSSHLPMLPIGFEWSYEVIHRRIIPGICALLCDDQQLFLRNLRQFSKTQEFTFIDFYFAKRETFSLLTGNKIKKIFPELSQELSLGVIQKIESVRRYMFPVKILADGEIRDVIMKGLMNCEQFVELFIPNKLTNKFLSNLLAQIFDYFYSDVESDSAPKPPKIRAICQPLLAQTLSRKLLDYIEAFTLRALQNDRFTLNLILRDLHYKFTKVRLRLGFKQGIFGHFDTFEAIDGLIEQLELEVKAAIHYGAADFFPESQRAKLTDMKFLKYYLKFLLAEHDIFSVFDFAVAMPYDGVLHSHFLFWMNCLRAVILTKYDFLPAQAHVFIRFLEACCPAS